MPLWGGKSGRPLPPPLVMSSPIVYDRVLLRVCLINQHHPASEPGFLYTHKGCHFSQIPYLTRALFLFI